MDNITNQLNSSAVAQTYNSQFNSAESEKIVLTQSRVFIGSKIVSFLKQITNQKSRINQQFYVGDYYERD